MPHSPETRAQSFVGILSRWWYSLIGNRASRLELNSICREDVGGVARDLGVNAEELHALAGKWPDSADLLNRRLVALALDSEEIHAFAAWCRQGSAKVVLAVHQQGTMRARPGCKS